MKKRSIHHSPWLAQLKKNRPVKSLNKNVKTDILIIGAGIAGMVTAYYLLKDTKNKVMVLEASKMAHGATGHNAGQIVSYFEYPFPQLVKEHGFNMALEAQHAVIHAWDLLDHIVQEVELKHRPSSFAGFAGCTTIPQLLEHLEKARLRHKGNLNVDFAYVEDNPKILRQIPKKYTYFYSIVPKDNILRKLETNNKDYIAATTRRKGCMNSAKFCEELLEYFQKTYPNRFTLYENTPVATVSAKKNLVVSKTSKYTIKSQKVILCTNGYATIKVINEIKRGKTIYDGLIKGLVGFMAGYEQKTNLSQVAISYFPKTFSSEKDTYYYLTRRRLENKKSLVCINGDEKDIERNEQYDCYKHYVPNGIVAIKKFLAKNHKYTPKNAKYTYQWEGLMGYTKNRIRCVGKDPYNPRIWYNLGCNGVGIMPSIYGAKRISLIMKGVKLKPSLFDPAYSVMGKIPEKKSARKTSLKK